MEVSDPGGRTWDGTAIRETLRTSRTPAATRGITLVQTGAARVAVPEAPLKSVRNRTFSVSANCLLPETVFMTFMPL
jgi:hypothetical protein